MAEGSTEAPIMRRDQRSTIPVVAVSETEPAGKSYQAWVMSELDAVDQALR
jgi:zinc/manganese transport system substrate-binding protein